MIVSVTLNDDQKRDLERKLGDWFEEGGAITMGLEVTHVDRYVDGLHRVYFVYETSRGREMSDYIFAIFHLLPDCVEDFEVDE